MQFSNEARSWPHGPPKIPPILCDASSLCRTAGRDNMPWSYLRFSPVWLHMCVCKEDGRVKRLPHFPHLGFLCELFESLNS